MLFISRLMVEASNTETFIMLTELYIKEAHIVVFCKEITTKDGLLS
jgi:hypothetical protein